MVKLRDMFGQGVRLVKEYLWSRDTFGSHFAPRTADPSQRYCDTLEVINGAILTPYSLPSFVLHFKEPPLPTVSRENLFDQSDPLVRSLS